MPCKINNSQIRDLFFQGLSYDYEKYRRYRSAIDGIIGMGMLDDESKVYSIWFMGLLYNQALEMDPNIVTEGLPFRISQAVREKLFDTETKFGELFEQVKLILEAPPSIETDSVKLDVDLEGEKAVPLPTILKPQFRGKLIYATPGAGKTTLSDRIEGLIDTDKLMIEEMNRRHPEFKVQLGETPQAFIYRYVKELDHKGEINAEVLRQAREFISKGQTVLTGTLAFVKDADVVITVPATNSRIINRLGTDVAEAFSEKEAAEVVKYGINSIRVQTNLENVLLEGLQDMAAPKLVSFKDKVNALLKEVPRSNNPFEVYGSFVELVTRETIDPQSQIELYRKFAQAVSKLKEGSVKSALVAKINSVIEGAQSPTLGGRAFVDLRNTQSFGKEFYLYTLEDGTVYEAIRDPATDNYYVYDSLFDGSNYGNLIPIPRQPGKDHIQPIYRSEDSDAVENASGEKFRVTLDFLTNGVRFYQVRRTPNEKEKTGIQTIADNTPVGSNIMSQIRLVADRREPAIFRDRIRRIQQIYPEVSRENQLRPDQVEALKANPNIPIVGFIRPTSGIQLKIYDLSGQNYDILQTFDHLRFIYADNRTEAIDWTNPNHVELFRSLVQVKKIVPYTVTVTDPVNKSSREETRYEAKYVTPTIEDVQHLVDTVNQIVEMKSEIGEMMGNVDTFEVPSDLVQRYINISNSLTKWDYLPAYGQPAQSLEDFVPQLVSISSTVTARIAPRELNKIGAPRTHEVVGVIERTSVGGFQFVDSIPAGHVILDEDGNQITTETLFTRAGFSRSYVQGILNSYSTHGSFYLYKNANGRWLPRPMKKASPIESEAEIIDFMLTLGSIKEFMPEFTDIETPGVDKEAKDVAVKVIQQFNNRGWGFNTRKGIIANIEFLRTMIINGRPDDVYGIKFRAIEGEYPYANAFNANAEKMVIEFPWDMLQVQKKLKVLTDALGIDMGKYTTLEQRLQLGRDVVKMLSADYATLSPTNKNLISDISAEFISSIPKIYEQAMGIIDTHMADVQDGEDVYLDADNSFMKVLFANPTSPKQFLLRNAVQSKNPLSIYKVFERTAGSASRKKVVVRLARNPIAIDPSATQVPKSSGGVSTDVRPTTEALKKPLSMRRPSFSIISSLNGIKTLGDAEWASDIADIQRMFGDIYQVSDEELQGYDVDGVVLGLVENRVIKLNKNIKARGVAFHEAFHAIFRFSMIGEQRQQYYDAVEKITGGVQSDEQGKFIKSRGKKVYLDEFRTRRRFYGIPDAEVANLIYEEYLADGFAIYKEEKKQPKNSLINLLYKLIEKLVNLFSSPRYQAIKDVKSLYEGIDAGRFKNILSIDPYQGPVAYELFYLPGYIGQDAQIIPYTMDALTTDQIRNRIVKKIAEYGNFPMAEFDRIYNDVTESLINYYDIDRLVLQNPAQADAIKATYGPMFKGFRFLMGFAHRFQGQMVMDNLSGDPQYDGYVYDDQAYSIQLFNKFKEQVKEDYDKMSIIDNDQQTTDEEDAATREVGTEADEVNEVNTLNDEDETGDRYDDGGILTLKPYEGSAEFQRLIRYIEYTFEDKKLGVKFEKMVNSKEIINNVRKTLANIPIEGLLSKLLQRVEFLESNIEAFNNSPVYADLGRIPNDMLAVMEQAATLRAVYDFFTRAAGIDENGNPTIDSGVPMIKMFHKVFEQANVPIIVQEIQTELQDARTERYSNTIANVDIVEKRTVENAKNRIESTIITSLNNLEVDGVDNYLKARDEVFATVLRGDARGKYIVPTTPEQFNDLVDGFYRATSLMGFDISRTLIEFSVAADTYRRTKGTARFVEDIVNADIDFYNKMQYMDPSDLMDSLKSIAEGILKSGTAYNRVQKLIDNYTKGALYEAKYDPTLFSVVLKNNEGKVISSFIPMTPSIRIVQNIKRYGLANTIEKYYPGMRFSDWFADNSMIAAAMDTRAFDFNDKSAEAVRINRMKKFFSVMRVSVAGGVTQTYGGRQFQSTFRHLGEKSYFLSVLSMFMDRTYQVDDYGNKMEIFERPITQFESTGTQFNVTGMYTNYAMLNLDINKRKFLDADPKAIKAAKVNNFMLLLYQDYNRIQREYLNRSDSSQRMEKYNSMTMADGTVDVENTSLRAYNFNTLKDFFAYADPRTNAAKIELNEIHNTLLNAAKTGVSFQAALDMTLTSTNGKLRPTLEAELLEYGDRKLQSFLDYLVSIQVLKPGVPGGIYMNIPDIMPRYVRPKEGAPGYFDKETISLNEAEKAMVVEDFVYNFWFNSMFVNQLFDGDMAVGVKDIIDYFKRQKSGVAAGSNYRNAFIPVEEDVTNLSIIRSQNEDPNDRQITGYIDKDDPYAPVVTNKDATNTRVAIADGLAYITMNRKIAKFDKDGLLTPRLTYLLKQMRHRMLTYPEMFELVDAGIILNSDKPVIAAPYDYAKDSEHVIIRSDVSQLKDPNMAFVAEQLYVVLDNIDFSQTEGVLDPVIFYQELIRRIHDLYKPVKGRELLHHFLNAMEYHRVDVLGDETIMKKGSPAPLVLDIAALENGIMDPELTMKVGDNVYPVFEDGYLNLAYSKRSVSNELVYEQVGTSRVSGTTTDSIQKKLLLTAGLNPNDPELKPIAKDILAVRELLNDIAGSRMQYLRRVLAASADPAAFLSKLVQRGLLKQGASSNILKYYEQDDEGRNIFNMNLPQLGKTPLFYFFSIFNKNVFSPKISGKKFFHVSPLGYKIKGEDGKYRYPKVYERTVTIDGESVTQTVVEAIVPRELAGTKEEREFFETIYAEFLGARIPTEERRSMVVVKVVDYVSPMYGNIIILPSQIHRFAGSDFDIDTLFTELPSYYRNMRGKLMKYGDYSYYTKRKVSLDDAKFIEYLHFIASDPMFDELIQGEKDRLAADEAYEEKSLSAGAGKFSPGIKNMFMGADEEAGEGLSKSQKEVKKIIERLIPAINMLNSLATAPGGMKVPSSPEELAAFTAKYKNPVTPVLQNELIIHNRNILSFTKVFDRYVKNFTADDAIEPYKKDAVLLSKLSGNTTLKKLNPFTFESVARMRATTKDAKYTLNGSANFNKAAAVMATADIRLTDKFTFKLSHNGKKARMLDRIGQYDEKVKKYDIVRTALMVGNVTGMATDDAKNLIAGILKINLNTVGVLDAMYLYGYPEQLARLIHSVGLINEGIDEYMLNNDPSFAEPGENRQSFTTFLNTYTNSNIAQNLQPLLQRGLVKETQSGTYEINPASFTILFDDVSYATDTADAESEAAYIEDISPKSFNITVLDKEGKELPQSLAEVMLLGFYQRMNDLGSSISFKIAPVTSTLKSIAPSFTRLSRIQEAVEWVKDNNVFKNAQDIFKYYPVLDRLGNEIVPEMIEISKDVLLDQTNLFKAVTGIFKNVYGVVQDEVVAELKSVLMMSAMGAYVREQAPKIQKEIGTRELTGEERIILAMNNTYSADYWANNTQTKGIRNDLAYLLQREPDNLFLRSLRPIPVRRRDNEEPVYVLESTNANRLSMENQERMIDEFLRLVNHQDKRIADLALNIAVHGIVKDGSVSRRGGYMKVLAPKLFLSMSQEMDAIQQGFKFADTSGKRMLKTYLERINGVFSKIYRSKTTGPLAMQALLNKMASILTINAIPNRRLRMSFFHPDMIAKKKDRREIYGTFYYIDNESLKSIIDNILPKNASLIYTEDRSGKIKSNHSGLRNVPGRKTRDWNYEFWKADSNEELFWDLTNISAELEQYSLDLLKRQGIYHTRDGQFGFPLYQINNYENGQMFMLTELDGKPFTEDLFTNLFQAYKEDGDFKFLLRGKTAKYKVVARQGTPKILPNSFTNQVGQDIRTRILGPASTTSERLTTIPQLPDYATVVDGSTTIVVTAPQEAAALQGRTFTRDGVRFQITQSQLKYSTNPSPYNKGKIFLNGKHISSTDQLDQFANFMGYANYNEFAADPGNSDFLNPVKKNNEVYVLTFTADQMPRGGTVAELGEPVAQRPAAAPVQAILEPIRVTPTAPTAPTAATTINIYAGTGENAELSNFAIRPFSIKTQTFNTVEGAFQAAKLAFTNEYLATGNLRAGDQAIIDKLRVATGAEARAIGRRIKGLNSAEWDKVSSNRMKSFIKSSFEQNPEALAKLLATGNATLTHAQDKGKWGKEFPRLLMEVREELGGAAPVQSQDDFAIADRLPPIEQNFVDGQGGRSMMPQFKGRSTMDLIISGDRTRTTRSKTEVARYMKDYGLARVSELMGKIVRMTDKTGRSVYARITNVAQFTQEYQDQTWQKEGWMKDVTDKLVGKYPYAIEFEVVKRPSSPDKLYSLQSTTDRTTPNSDNPRFRFEVRTLSAINDFLDKINVGVELVDQITQRDGSPMRNAVAAADFIKMTAQIVRSNNALENAKNWDQLPEEAAHFWFRMLKKDSKLRKALLENVKTSERVQQLIAEDEELGYREAYGLNNIDALSEEAIGQLVADAIERIQNQNATEQDYSFIKALLDKIKEIVDLFTEMYINKDGSDNYDPYEIAAMKILSSDTSDLLTVEEYQELNGAYRFDNNQTFTSLTIDDLKPQGISVMPMVVGLRDENIDPNDPINQIINYEVSIAIPVVIGDPEIIGTVSSEAEVIPLIRKERPKHLDIAYTRKMESTETTNNISKYYNKLVTGQFKKRSRFLKKTIQAVMNSVSYFLGDDAKEGRAVNLLDAYRDAIGVKITRPLSEQEITYLKDYSTITPTLMILPAVLEKYKNNPISLSQAFGMKGMKKKEGEIINKVIDKIKEENPGMRTISATDLINEVHNWLELNYAINFNYEIAHLNYGIPNTFMFALGNVTDDTIVDLTHMTEAEARALTPARRQEMLAAMGMGVSGSKLKIQHRKMSMRFNNERNLLASGHFGNGGTAFASLTPFFTDQQSAEQGRFGGVMLHEIQSDTIEAIEESLDKTGNQALSLDAFIKAYVKSLDENAVKLEEQISVGGITLPDTVNLLSNYLTFMVSRPKSSTLLRILQEMWTLYGFATGSAETGDFEISPSSLQTLGRAFRERSQEIYDLYKDTDDKIDEVKKNIDFEHQALMILNDISRRKNIDIKDVISGVVRLTGRKIKLLDDVSEIGISLISSIMYNVDQIYDPAPGVRNKLEAHFTSIIQTRLDRKFQKLREKEAAETLNPIVGTSVSVDQLVNESFENFYTGKFPDAMLTSVKQVTNVTIANLRKTLGDYYKYKSLANAANQYRKLTNNHLFTLYKNMDVNRALLKAAMAKEYTSDSPETKKRLQRLLDQRSKIGEYKMDAVQFEENLRSEGSKSIMDKLAEESYARTMAIIERESNYFVPLVDQQIQTHIREFGHLPLYFSGFDASTAIQANRIAAVLYAGPEEVSKPTPERMFEMKATVMLEKGGFLTPEAKNTLMNELGITDASGSLAGKYTPEFDAKLDQLIKKYKNLDPTVYDNPYGTIWKKTDIRKSWQQSMLRLNNDRPIAVGPLYAAMSKMPGVRLEYVKQIPGMKQGIGGYLVDLSNYTFQVPKLFSLRRPEVKTAEPEVQPIEQPIEDLYQDDNPFC